MSGAFKGTITQIGFPNSYVAYQVDPCSGLTCAKITCYKVTFGYPSKIGEDMGPITQEPEVDLPSCTIKNKK